MRRLTTITLALAASALVGSANLRATAADGTALSWDLIAGQTLDIGSVTVDRVGDDLQVVLAVDPGWMMTQAHVYAGLEPPRRSAPGSFGWGGILPVPASVHVITIPLAQIGAGAGDTVYVAAHAEAESTGEYWIVSDPAFTRVTAFENVPYDPDHAAVASWCHEHWEEHILPGFAGTGAQCVWATEYVTFPGEGEVVDFRHAFAIGGYVEQAFLSMAADNGYEAYLNGTFVGSEGLLEGWRSDHTQIQSWDWVHGPMTYDVTDLLQVGANTMLVGAGNAQAPGETDTTNPAGLIYGIWVRGTVPESGQSAWADGLEGTPIRAGKGWGTYVAYEIPGL